MRILVDHRTTYDYARPASGIVQALRLRPHDHDGQHVRSWRIDADVNGAMRDDLDAFGNVVTMFYVEGAITSLTLTVTGEVHVEDTAGIVRARETLPPMVYLRSTPLTEADDAIVALAEGARGADTIGSLHRLMSALHAALGFDTRETDSRTRASEAFAAGQGVCQDFAHIFCAGARTLGIPARYVSGHLAREGGQTQDASHAWAEAHVEDLGWVAFDAANGICPTECYVRVAIGLDYLDAAPVRGARRGGGMESMRVSVRAGEADLQSQTQG